MCGIVGYIGDQDSTPIILNGLKRLEYRGYDSAGVAVLDNGHIEIRRDAGKLNHLEALVHDLPLHGKIGIGHTRWATHGEPNARNAHPHIGSTGEFVVVHNGIVENYLTLREELAAEGTVFIPTPIPRPSCTWWRNSMLLGQPWLKLFADLAPVEGRTWDRGDVLP